MSSLSYSKHLFKLPKRSADNGLVRKVSSLFRQWDGKLSQQLALENSQFGRIPKRLLPDQTTNMTCGFCATGCGLTVHLQNKVPVNLTPNTHYPVNQGKACPKGWEALSPLFSPNRATSPMLRNAEGILEPVNWEMALRAFTAHFKQIQQNYGAESIAFLSTGQIATEEMAFLGALAKFGMGMVHGDGNTRPCMATAVTAYKQSFGFDAPPYTYQDFEESDVLVFVGANPCIAHPIMWERVCMNRHNPKIIVIDPRTTETAMQATHHYALAPKSDLMLLYAVAHVLVENQWIDQKMIEENTLYFAEFEGFLRNFNPARASRVTGLSISQIHQLAQLIHEGQRVSFWWTMGVNQSHQGTRTAQALINLALMTGNIGRPGTGANSITGQCNAMGSRLFSNTTSLLGGHDFLNPAHRQKVASLLKLDVSQIPDQNSWPYHQILAGIETGKIKGLWIIATNPAHSWIQQESFHELRKKLDFLVVQDMYHTTETAQMADLLLPAAAWGEKEGTFINSERRIGLLKRVSQAPGQALADFYIFKLIAEYWGCGGMFREWESPQAVFQIIKRLTQGQPCDINGIDDYVMLEQQGGIQWPFAEKNTVIEKERRLFTDGKFYHPDQKAYFLFEEPRVSPELPDEAYPLLLLTGRGSSSQWHTQTRTSQSNVLRQLSPEQIYAEIHPQDAETLGIDSGTSLLISSRRGSIQTTALVQPTVQPGQIFIPMHYATTNQLTLAVFDPYSHQPAYKACAVRVEIHKS